MTDSPETRAELSRIRALFRVTRAAGLWASRYPQTEYSALLGVTIREQLGEPDSDLPVTVLAVRAHVQHASGHALPTPGFVRYRVPVA